MDRPLADMQSSLQDALDDLLSPRSSTESKTRALEIIEHHLALACMPDYSDDDLSNFLALQYTFECNIASHLLAWIALSTSKLEVLTNKGSIDREREAEVLVFSSQLSTALFLIQGVALNHPPSKRYLGRKYALGVLLDLLLASRHLSSVPAVPTTDVSGPSSLHYTQPKTVQPPLSSVVLDTFLCVLVDSSSALRTFEESNGVQAVVKILKRAGTPREVRMKCLEFLYFYLLDETPSSLHATAPSPQKPIPAQALPSTAPTTPLRPSKLFISNTPIRPMSYYGSSTYAFTSGSSEYTSSSSSRSSSSGSSSSFSSTSSYASSSTAPSTSASSPPSPEKRSLEKLPRLHTPPNPPPLPQGLPQQLQPRSLLMLRKDLDFVPLSPKKVQVAKLGVAGAPLSHIRGKSLSKPQSKLGNGLSEEVDENQSPVQSQSQARGSDTEKAGEEERKHTGGENMIRGKIRTTEEKKELLGTMLGNVDALVDGVRKAGIWGLK